MKTPIFTVLFVIIAMFNTNAQSSGVTFLRGLGEEETVWSGMSSELQQQYNYAERFEDFYGYYSINYAASTLNIPSGEVVVAHSQGGLLAREVLRDGSTGDFKALITVGTPHEGAPIASAALNGTVSNVFARWTWDLAFGFLVYYGPGQSFRSQVFELLAAVGLIQAGKFALEEFVIDKYRNQQGVTDMIPGSVFLSNLNAQPNNTLPSARYAIYGAEGFPTPWHLMGSAAAGPGNIEDPVGIEAHSALVSFYTYITTFLRAEAYSYKYLMERAKENYNFADYFYYRELYMRTMRSAAAFKVGLDSLLYGQQYQWSKYVTGALTSSAWYVEDGILAAPTQAPTFFDQPDNIERRLVALNANHIEETAHPNVRERLEEAFGNSDVNLPEAGAGDEPLSVTVNGPAYLSSDQMGTWTADVSNNEGSISYKWYRQPVNSNTWAYTGDTDATYSTSFYNGSSGAKNAGVKVEITSAGESAYKTRLVNIQSGDCNIYTSTNSESIGTNRIPPPCGN